MKPETTIEASLRRRADSSRFVSRLSLILAIFLGVSLIFILPMPYEAVLDTSPFGKLNDPSPLYGLLFEAIYRVTSAVIAILLINALIGFAKYHSRLAEHFESVASSIALSGTESERLKYYADILSCAHVSSGKDGTPTLAEFGDIAEKISKLK